MKISQQTLSILKNFASINGNILVRAGSNISTISPQKNILANANITEAFPVEFAIYDLSQFLSAISLFEDPEFDFTDKYVTISSGRRSIKYFFAEPSMILAAPEKKLTLPTTEVDFVATSGNISEVLKASAVLQTPEIVVSSETGSTQIELIATAVNNNTSNRYAVAVDASSDDTFRMVFKSENLKLVPGDYRIGISSKGMGRFFNEKLGLEYFIATETTSKYGA
jgi:hypothetical protein